MTGSEFGTDHIMLVEAIASLVWIYYSQGKYRTAISHFKRALNIFDMEFEVGHIDSTEALTSLGWIYDCIGKYQTALSYHERGCQNL